MGILGRLNRRLLLRYRLEYAAALLGVYAVRALSPAFAWEGARALARLAWRIGLRRREVLRNLEAAFPDWEAARREEVGRRCMEHFFSLAVDVLFQKRLLSRRNLLEHIEFKGWTKEYLDKYGIDALRERVRGILLLTAHLGNWELGSGVFGLLGVPIVPIFRSLRNPFMDRLLRRIRLSVQQRVIERRGAVQAMIDHLQAGDNVGFLFDQEAVHGLYVPFFGVPACTHKTPAVLARDYGVPVFFGWMMRKGDGLRYEARGRILEINRRTEDKAADVEAITVELMRTLEEEIRVRPEQYFWMHRRWKRTGLHGAHYLPEKRK